MGLHLLQSGVVEVCKKKHLKKCLSMHSLSREACLLRLDCDCIWHALQPQELSSRDSLLCKAATLPYVLATC